MRLEKNKKKGKGSHETNKRLGAQICCKGKFINYFMNIFFYFHMVFLVLLHLTSILWFWNLCSLLGAEMINKNDWKCTICNFNGTLGVVDIIGHHVKGATHVLVKRNRLASQIVSSQMSIEDFFYERGSCRLNWVSSILHTYNCWYSLQWIAFPLCTTCLSWIP